MARIDTCRGTIGVSDGGGGDPATPILFLHGVGSDRSVWHPQLDHLAGRRRALAIDHPGYGDSEFHADAARDDFAAAGWAALDALGIGRAHLCGLSLGGVVAIAMHHAAPGRVASLVIADSFAVHPDGPAIHQRSVAASQTMPMRALAEARVPALVGASASAELRAELVETMAAIDPAAFRIGSAAVWLADQCERVARIAVPTLVLVGNEDQVTPPTLSVDLHRRIVGSTLAMINHAGHLANVEQPEMFNGLVDRFLTTID